MDHFEAEVIALRRLEHVLDEEAYTEAQLRRELHSLIEAGRRGLSLASAFHFVVDDAASNGRDPAQELRDDDVTATAVQHLTRRWRDGASAVSVELKVLEGLVAHLVDLDPGNRRQAAICNLITERLHHASLLIDRAIPPDFVQSTMQRRDSVLGSRIDVS